VTRRSIFAAGASVLSALALAAPASAAPVQDAIWVNAPTGRAATVTMRYGDSFTAGYTSRAAQPWALAECWADGSTVLGTPNLGTYNPGDVIWSQYRSLYAGGPAPGAFDLIDPIQGLWLGGGATCRLSLVKFSGGYKSSTVLATSTFAVA
jgi:hypothetical protein